MQLTPPALPHLLGHLLGSLNWVPRLELQEACYLRYAIDSALCPVVAVILGWGCEGADYLRLLGMWVFGLMTLRILRQRAERIEGVATHACPVAEAVICTGGPYFHAGYL